METLWTALRSLLELDSGSEPGAGAMALRTVIVYAVTLALVRLGSRRLLAKPSAFDVIVAIMIGSIMSRAINGASEFFATFGAGAVLLGMHWAFAALAYHTDWLGNLVKGRRIPLVRDGEVLEEGMRKAHITPEDLREALRLQAHDDDVSKVRAAYMERNGAISVIFRRQA